MGSPATRIRGSGIVGLVGLAIVVVSADGELPNTGMADAVSFGPTAFTPRVRILSPQMAHAFWDGISRSPTFRRLVDVINASDGIVYVEYGVCRSVARGCLLGSLNLAGPHRILRVVIRKTQLADDLVVSLGHELQHALEVLANPPSRRPQKCGGSSRKSEFGLAMCSRPTMRSGLVTRSVESLRPPRDAVVTLCHSDDGQRDSFSRAS